MYPASKMHQDSGIIYKMSSGKRGPVECSMLWLVPKWKREKTMGWWNAGEAEEKNENLCRELQGPTQSVSEALETLEKANNTVQEEVCQTTLAGDA